MLLKPANLLRFGQALVTRKVPVYAHYGITHRCDLTCKMCGIWRYGNKKEELSVPEIAEMARRFRRLGVAQVSIGGGEPFAYEELEDAAEAFIREGINLRLLTNAVQVPRERLQRCLDVGVKNFSISLDSLYPSRFDDICEKEGSWEGAVRNMSWLAQQLHGKGGSLVMNCVVSRLNLEEIPDLVRFARAIGFSVSLLPVELLPDKKAGVRNWEARFIRWRPEMSLQDSEEGELNDRIDRVYRELIQMKRDGWPIFNSTPYLKASAEYLKSGSFPAEGCDAGRLYFSVSPNGQFTICHRTTHQYTHVLDPDFERYLRSAEFELRRKLEAGSCEGCMRACWIDTSSMFRTMEGFFDTARMTLRRPGAPPVSTEEALSWARSEEASLGA